MIARAEARGSVLFLLECLEKSAEKLEGLLGGFYGIVAVSGQLNVDGADVADLAKRAKNRREVDIALAKHEVFVDAATHVLHVHVP